MNWQKTAKIEHPPPHLPPTLGPTTHARPINMVFYVVFILWIYKQYSVFVNVACVRDEK